MERCGVEVARDTYCFCNVNCEDQCCYDGIIAASIGNDSMQLAWILMGFPSIGEGSQGKLPPPQSSPT